MPVFRAYFKVMRVALPIMLIYLATHLGVAAISSFHGNPAQAMDFSQTKVPMAIINRDGASPLVDGLTAYLADVHRKVSLPDDPEELQDALYFRNVEYIVIIPRGFSTGFLAGEKVALQKVIVPNSMSSYYVDRCIDNYLKTFRLIHNYGRGGSDLELLAAVRADLAAGATVSVHAKNVVPPRGFVFYFIYFAYVLLALVVLGVSTTMLSFNQPDLQRRIQCTPQPARRMTMLLAAGHGLVALGSWAALIVFGLILYGKNLQGSGLLGLFCLNSLAYAAVCTSIGLAVGSLIKDRNAQSAATTVIAVGMSFLSGVFVPQSLMSPAVLSFARFLPAYWYAKASNAIGALANPAVADLSSVHGDIMIQLGFAAAIFSVTLLLGKERKTSAG